MILDDNYEIILLILSWKHRFLSLPEPSGSQRKLMYTNAPASLSVVCFPLSVVNNVLLGQSKPSFMWSLLWKGEQKFI